MVKNGAKNRRTCAMAVQGSSRLAPFDMLRKISKEKKHGAGYGEKTGKRTRAVNEKKEAILAAALETFSCMAFTARALKRWRSGRGCQKPIFSTITRQKKRSTLPCCATFSLSGWRR
jgi:hypothetical protein